MTLPIPNHGDNDPLSRPRAFVLLKSGRSLDLLNSDPQAWTDEDLAAGLARTLRRGGSSKWEHSLSVAQHILTVLALRELDGWLPAGERLREVLRDATEFMLGWDCISPLKPRSARPSERSRPACRAAVDARYRLPPWTDETYPRHKLADRLAAACEAFHVVGWSRTDMIEALDFVIAPLTTDPLCAPRGFAPWEPWPPKWRKPASSSASGN